MNGVQISTTACNICATSCVGAALMMLESVSSKSLMLPCMFASFEVTLFPRLRRPSTSLRSGLSFRHFKLPDVLRAIPDRHKDKERLL
jgi:hypothetical protein